MIPKDKVQEIISRHDTLEKELSSGNIDKNISLQNQKNIQILETSFYLQENI